jgi:hypothetical protein
VGIAGLNAAAQPEDSDRSTDMHRARRGWGANPSPPRGVLGHQERRVLRVVPEGLQEGADARHGAPPPSPDASGGGAADARGDPGPISRWLSATLKLLDVTLAISSKMCICT